MIPARGCCWSYPGLLTVRTIWWYKLSNTSPLPCPHSPRWLFLLLNTASVYRYDGRSLISALVVWGKAEEQVRKGWSVIHLSDQFVINNIIRLAFKWKLAGVWSDNHAGEERLLPDKYWASIYLQHGVGGAGMVMTVIIITLLGHWQKVMNQTGSSPNVPGTGGLSSDLSEKYLHKNWLSVTECEAAECRVEVLIIPNDEARR